MMDGHIPDWVVSNARASADAAPSQGLDSTHMKAQNLTVYMRDEKSSAVDIKMNSGDNIREIITSARAQGPVKHTQYDVSGNAYLFGGVTETAAMRITSGNSVPSPNTAPGRARPDVPEHVTEALVQKQRLDADLEAQKIKNEFELRKMQLEIELMNARNEMLARQAALQASISMPQSLERSESSSTEPGRPSSFECPLAWEKDSEPPDNLGL